LRTVCLGWLQTTILLISASWVARITGMSLWCPAILLAFRIKKLIKCSSLTYHCWWNFKTHFTLYLAFTADIEWVIVGKNIRGPHSFFHEFLLVLWYLNHSFWSFSLSQSDESLYLLQGMQFHFVVVNLHLICIVSVTSWECTTRSFKGKNWYTWEVIIEWELIL
jgi:hypothetical protein